MAEKKKPFVFKGGFSTKKVADMAQLQGLVSSKLDGTVTKPTGEEIPKEEKPEEKKEKPKEEIKPEKKPEEKTEEMKEVDADGTAAEDKNKD